MKYNMSNFSLQEYLEKTEKEFNKKFPELWDSNDCCNNMFVQNNVRHFLCSAIETAVKEAVRSTFIKSLIDQERNDIWKWIGENSWVQDSPTGEVRVIDVDELADYWRKQEYEIQSQKN